MGVADFPVEIFKAFKAKPQQSISTDEFPQGSGSASPRSISRSQSRADLSVDSSTPGVSSSAQTPTQQPASSATSDIVSVTESDPKSPTDTPLTSVVSSGSIPRGGRSLQQALRGTLSRSRSGSRDRKPRSRSGSPMGRTKEFDPSNITLDSAIGASKGISRIVGAGLKSPMDFTLGLARGFHNAPKLYGDDTVRPQEKVTDFQSGLRAAGKVRY